MLTTRRSDALTLSLSLYERNTIDADQALTALLETQEPYVRRIGGFNVGGAYFNKYVYEGLVARIKGDAAAAQKAFEAARALYEKDASRRCLITVQVSVY